MEKNQDKNDVFPCKIRRKVNFGINSIYEKRVIFGTRNTKEATRKQ